MNTFSNIVKQGEDTSLGIAVQKLIEDNISRLNTSFLAKVTEVGADGLVSIVDIAKTKTNPNNPIISNCIYGIPSTGAWKVSQKPTVGDYGIAIVLKRDNSIYKINKEGGQVNSNRLFDLNDTIFLPLTLLNQPSDDNYSISSKDDKVKLQLTNTDVVLASDKSNITLNKDLTIQSNNVSVKSDSNISIKSDSNISINSSKGIELKSGGGDLEKVLEAVITYVSTCQFGVYPYNGATSKPAEELFKMTVKQFIKGGL